MAATENDDVEPGGGLAHMIVRVITPEDEKVYVDGRLRP